MNKHSTGKWTHDALSGHIWGQDKANGEMICIVRNWGYLKSIQKLSEEEAIAVQEANARLICAAPEMLEAIQKAVAYMDKTSSDADRYHGEMMIPLRGALKAALGEE